jgi:cystathionine gamma-synthase
MSDEVHLDSNIPGNPAYHFTIVPPGTAPQAGWARRAPLVAGARPGTQCVHAGVQPDLAYGAVMPPIYQTSTFAFRDVCTNAGYDYTRSGNPTRATLEEAISVLEGGAGATCTSTGMSAVIVALNLLPQGSHLLCTVDCYGGTFRALEHAKATYGLEVTYLDLADLAAVRAAFRPNTRMVWIETPSNPLLRLTDIRAVADLARAHDALTVVDNTFLSPVLQKPFQHGADLVVHSTTKYLNGHSDVVGGVVVAAPGRTALVQRIQSVNNLLGTSQSPHDCFLVLRGLKTLLIRMKAHEAGAQAIAAWLARHPAIDRVFYPGLATHPQHALARSLFRGFGALLSFELAADVDLFASLNRLRIVVLSSNLGDNRTLAIPVAHTIFWEMGAARRAEMGIADSLIRVSVGIEDRTDLLGDFAQALG